MPSFSNAVILRCAGAESGFLDSCSTHDNKNLILGRGVTPDLKKIDQFLQLINFYFVFWKKWKWLLLLLLSAKTWLLICSGSCWNWHSPAGVDSCTPDPAHLRRNFHRCADSGFLNSYSAPEYEILTHNFKKLWEFYFWCTPVLFLEKVRKNWHLIRARFGWNRQIPSIVDSCSPNPA